MHPFAHISQRRKATSSHIFRVNLISESLDLIGVLCPCWPRYFKVGIRLQRERVFQENQTTYPDQSRQSRGEGICCPISKLLRMNAKNSCEMNQGTRLH